MFLMSAKNFKIFWVFRLFLFVLKENKQYYVFFFVLFKQLFFFLLGFRIFVIFSCLRELKENITLNLNLYFCNVLIKYLFNLIKQQIK